MPKEKIFVKTTLTIGNRVIEVESCRYPKCDKCGCLIDPDEELIFCADCEQKHPAELQRLYECYGFDFNITCPSKGCINHMTKIGNFLTCQNCKRIIKLEKESERTGLV